MDNFLIDHLKSLDSYKQIIDRVEGSHYIYGMSQESLPHFIYALWLHSKKSIFFIAENEGRARQIYESARDLPGIDIMHFPRTDFSFHDIAALDDEVNSQRLRIMERLAKGDNFITVASADSLAKKIRPKDQLGLAQLTITDQDEIDLEDLEARLADLGYQRLARVQARGEFAVRGGIVDIYPMGYDRPVRLELFDTEIDSMRAFDPQSQRSIGEVDRVNILPVKDLGLTRQEGQAIGQAIKEDLEAARSLGYSRDIYESLEEKFLKLVDKLENGQALNNNDLLAAYLKKDSYANILDYVQGPVVYDDMDKVFARLRDQEESFNEDLAYQMEMGQALGSQAASIYTSDKVLAKAKALPAINISQLKQRLSLQEPDKIERISTSELVSYAKNFKGLVEELRARKAQGYQIIILNSNAKLAENLIVRLEENGLATNLLEDPATRPEPGRIIVAPFSLARGIDYMDTRTLIISQHEIYGSQRKKAGRQRKKPADRLSLEDLEVDDYVVHINHGIAIYKGLEEIEIGGVSKDYLVLEYRGTDKLYLPTDQMDLIQPYVATGDKRPSLSKLGSGQWAKTKARAKKMVDEIAEDLVQLYAKRSQEKGYAFSPDTDWQREFEASFEYEETQAQERAIEEIKEDMESERPMDRVLLGDVGFGKTEVAVRAAFKASMNSKQVAFLVPTTILAQQHYTNIKERLKDYPVNVQVLSRFTSPSQQKDIIEATRLGEVDILIGTHRILSDDIVFKDLGLLIIDEEQRFGVKHKEKLKLMKENIDVLTLTATPIPRTLQMGLVGIRDMSVLDEGPANRYPSNVYIIEFDPAIARDAIKRELARAGQVYFVYNRVKDMDKITSRLRELIPEARIVMAHGQMNESDLEKIMDDFASGLYDILVSTSIIETGLDIHNVNTMIVYNADQMGLSQLYQLKGRIGRSNRQAYAYFTYKEDKSLSELSQKRLKAIRDFSDQGSGMKVSMKDLELRGAGNILGESQSGHIDSIGYDLYMKFLEDAIAGKKGQAQGQNRVETEIDLAIDAYIPNDYIGQADDKIQIYQRISEVSSWEDYYDIIDELVDRFGDLLEPVSNIIGISLIKNLASGLGFTEISGNKNQLNFAYQSRDFYNIEDLEVLSKRFGDSIKFDLSKRPSFSLRPSSLNHIYEFLETISHLQGKKRGNDLQAG